MSRRIVRKVVLYRNADPNFRPVSYVYNSQKTRTFEQLLDDVERLIQPIHGGGLRTFYSMDGNVRIDSLDAFENYQLDEFVAAGPERYRSIETTRSLPKQRQFQRQQSLPKVDRSNLRELNRQEYGREKTTSKPPSRESENDIYILRSGDARFGPRIYQVRYAQSTGGTGNWNDFLEDLEGIAPSIDGSPIQHVYTLDGNEIRKVEKLAAGEGYVVSGGCGYQSIKGGYERLLQDITTNYNEDDQRMAPNTTSSKNTRSKLQDMLPIHRRNSQVKPQNLLLHIFQNGEGLTSTRFLLTPLQLKHHGLPWLTEEAGTRFRISGKQICSMDGKMVTKIEELVSKGAYVIVPHGESFRKTWYFLPDGALDTAEDSNDMRMISRKSVAETNSSRQSKQSKAKDQWYLPSSLRKQNANEATFPGHQYSTHSADDYQSSNRLRRLQHIKEDNLAQSSHSDGYNRQRQFRASNTSPETIEDTYRRTTHRRMFAQKDNYRVPKNGHESMPLSNARQLPRPSIYSDRSSLDSQNYGGSKMMSTLHLPEENQPVLAYEDAYGSEQSLGSSSGDNYNKASSRAIANQSKDQQPRSANFGNRRRRASDDSQPQTRNQPLSYEQGGFTVERRTTATEENPGLQDYYGTRPTKNIQWRQDELERSESTSDRGYDGILSNEEEGDKTEGSDDSYHRRDRQQQIDMPPVFNVVRSEQRKKHVFD